MATPMPSDKGHCYPVEIINRCVWLYFRFPLSFREVEELMLERGVVVSDETIRRWCTKFGQAYANQLRRRRARPGDKWHLDEVSSESTAGNITCGGRSTSTATYSMYWSSPDETGTPPSDSSVSYSRACTMCREQRHRQARQLPSGTPRAAGLGRASPIQVLEQSSRELASTRQAARSGHETVHIGPARATLPVRLLGLSTFSGISPHFQSCRHRLPAPECRTEMTHRFAVWQEVTATGVVA